MLGANYFDVIQGSPEWLKMRAGCITSHGIAKVVGKRKRGEGELQAKIDYRMAKVGERLTGLTDEAFVSEYMEWGTEKEPLARAAYEIAKDVTVDTIGLVVHPTINWAACSPDGLIGTDGLIEIKCPKTTTHLEYLIADVPPVEYRPQMLWQMECCERQWCDFVSYDPRLPSHLKLFICRFQRDDKAIEEMRAEVIKFNAEIEDIIKSLPTKKGVSALEHQLTASLHITEHDIRSAL